MVKFVVVMFALSCCAFAYGECITNIVQCMNTNLTADVLARFPSNCNATVQNCVLTFVKGGVEGDLRTFASPFSTEVLSSEFGITNLDDIPSSIQNEFATLMNSISNSAVRIVSYCETTTSGVVKANISLHRQALGYNRIEVVHLDLSQTNDVWCITNWDADE